MARFIINCDDFGQDKGVNRAIREAFCSGIISSTTLLANMDGFDDAVSMVLTRSIPIHAVGIHLNLTQGAPLSQRILSESRFCNDGLFHGNARQTPLLYLTKSENQAVCDEVEAQILRLREHGIPISHADGHHHIHTEWGIFNAIENLLKEYQITKIRISRTLGVSHRNFKSSLKLLYKIAFNIYLKRKGFSTCKEMGEFSDFFKSTHLDGPSEIMVHFVPSKNKFELDAQSNPDYQVSVIKFLKQHELISYSDIN